VRGRGYIFDTGVQESSVSQPLPLAEQVDVVRVTVEEHEEAPDVTSARALRPAIAARRSANTFRLAFVAAGGILVLGIGIVAAYNYFRARASAAPIESIAVLPFKNESENPEVEYLADGMTESLINSVSQLPQLSVKARSTVFRYKGQQPGPQRIASELSVQAIVEGRLIQRGDGLTLYLALVDGRNGNQIWGQQYDRKLNELLTLQGEVARDVSHQLRARMSGDEEQKLAKKYTANVEAYQLYLRGRYHSLKRTLAEREKAISYFQQAIALDPSYALAYAGLADAHLSALAADLPPSEFLPQARAAAQTAIEIDGTLAAAHAQLGFVIFWYDWDWKASENEIKRALELNPDAADTHLYYAHVLSNTGRHMEALAESKRAREIDPLNLRNNALEGQFLIHAGRADEALTRLQATLDMDPNYLLAYMYRSSAYIEKGMYTDAVTEARKAREISGNRSTYAAGFEAYALAKSGKTAEARSILESLLKASAEKYTVALVYNGLGEHDAALSWLERAYAQRSAAMVFLAVEPKWNDLRSDLRFQDLLRRLRLTP
jgi:TolB-like protein/Tfp pilus assembly protein PilF